MTRAAAILIPSGPAHAAAREGGSARGRDQRAVACLAL